MSKILVCYKWVRDEVDARVSGDGTINFSSSKSKINDYDCNAIEFAMQVSKASGYEVEVLTFGNDSVKKSTKEALSRGPNAAHLIISDNADTADGAVTASALAAAVRVAGDVDIVICSEGSSDMYARQVGPRVASLLNWPIATCVTNMEITAGKAVATRKLDGCMQELEIDLPAVISVLPEASAAPIPGLKAVLAANKKPVMSYDNASVDFDENPKSRVISETAYVMDRKNIIIQNESALEKAAELVTDLRKEGVI